MSDSPSTKKLRLGRVDVALHTLVVDEGTPLLLLHELGESAESWRDGLPDWPGPIHALDFAGHGESDALRGGGYYTEYFLANADAALAAIGDSAAVAGAGVGAYVALLLAGSRPDRVPAALLLGGVGLAGAGSMPDHDNQEIVSLEEWERRIEAAGRSYRSGTDPMVSLCERDFRPDDYVESFAAAAPRLLLAEAVERSGDAPSWWKPASRAPGAEVVAGDRATAFARLAAILDV